MTLTSCNCSCCQKRKNQPGLLDMIAVSSPQIELLEKKLKLASDGIRFLSNFAVDFDDKKFAKTTLQEIEGMK
jgi:hypothetical protein